MKRIRLTPNQFEIETLKKICKNNNCNMETLINAIHSNFVSNEISIQIHYMKTGELPK